MTEEILQQVREIKQELRAVMNGPVSNSLREKGLRYRVIYGVEWSRLVEMASQMEKSTALANELWKEDIRECKLLAGLLQPVDDFPMDLAEIWIEGMHFPEEAQYTVMSLFQHLPYAKRAAFQWISRDNEMYQLCGFLLFSRLFMQDETQVVDDRNANEFLDQAESLLKSGSASIQSAVQNALMKYALLGDIEEQKVNRILQY